MLNYPFDHKLRLLAPTMIYIDTEGNLIELRLNNYQVQSIINDWADDSSGVLAEGEAPHLLNPPQGHVSEYVGSA